MRLSGVGGLRFKFRVGRIGHCGTNDSPLLQHFNRSCVTLVKQPGDGPHIFATCFGVITASKLMIFFDYCPADYHMCGTGIDKHNLPERC